MTGQPAWNEVLRALREARGVSQDGWATRLGYSRRTLQRWEQGEGVPDAAAETAILALCSEQMLFRPYDRGPLSGQTVTASWLQEILAAARLEATATAAVSPARPAVAAALLTNLPVALTNFVGREQEQLEITRLLGTTRLLTLTGPGGTGKTRLAIETARTLLPAFPNGIFFVNLAPLANPELVPAAVAQTLGVQGLPDVPLRDSVLRFVREKRLLLVLDNYEHLLAAAEFAGALLQAGPALTLLVTSRAPLRLRGEWEYQVEPLPLPAASHVSLAELERNPAVALFVSRAMAVRAGFSLTEENAASIATVCVRLDGLPLAIELAAARVRALPPDGLLARLAQRLPVLTGGARDMPVRQQTLRDTIAWSFALLAPAEQRLIRRLGVFAGGCTLELAEAVCNADGDLGIDVVEGVSSLLENSLLRASDGPRGEPRYRMLETIREFAVGELEASGEAETVRRQFAVQVLQLARQAVAVQDWATLDPEMDNARAVLGWCVDRAELGIGVRLLWALQVYLRFQGGLKELEDWRQRLLALPEAVQPSISRVRLLALLQYDFLSDTEHDQFATELEEAIALSRDLGDQTCLAVALRNLAFLRVMQGRYDDADPLAEEAFPLWLATGASEAAVIVRGLRISVALARGELDAAEALLAANRSLAGTMGSTWLLHQEAWLAEARGDVAAERRLLEEFVDRVEIAQGAHNPVRLTGLANLAMVALRQGDTRAAVTACDQSLTIQRRLGPSRFLPGVLSVLTLAAERGGLHSLSARLSAAVAAGKLQPLLLSAAMVQLQVEQQAAVPRVRVALGEAAFTEAWAEGETLSADAAIEFGLEAVAELQQLLAEGAADQPGERSAVL